MAASSSEIGRFETQYLTKTENLKELKSINQRWIDKANQNRKFENIILDIDSSESKVYGNQEVANYNGYFGCKCYHPLFCFKTLVLPQKISHWTLTTLRERLIKLGARLIKHASYAMFQVSEFVVTGATFGNILQNIHHIRLYSG